ncbi:hypothetical protein AY600_17970 [Phormidium willei BDU 130791]|nr:hypothetical protein AY600_17970 [Phormidium willei BDU 130791]
MEIAAGTGITALEQRYLRWETRDRFRLTIQRNLFETELGDGALALGAVLREGGDLILRLDSLHRIDRGICSTSGEYHRAIRHPKRDDGSGYIRLGPEWLEKERTNPFVQRACGREGLVSRMHIPITTAMEIEGRFYASPRQIERGKAAEQRFATPSALPAWIVSEYCRRMRFDPPMADRPHIPGLTGAIEAARQHPETMVIVNFVDELDPFSLAQQEFINLVITCLPRQSPRLRIDIIDVVIRDREGRRAFEQEFRAFHAANLLGADAARAPASPFTGVLGQRLPDVEEEHPAVLPLFDRRRLYDFDLFAGCRDAEGRVEARGSYARGAERYKLNLRRAVFNLFKLAAEICTRETMIEFKDLRGLSHPEAVSFMYSLSKRAALVAVNAGRESEAFTLACMGSTQAIFEGFPNVIVLLVDEPRAPYKLRVYTSFDAGGIYYYDYAFPCEAAGDVLTIADDIREAYREIPTLGELLEPCAS